MAGFAGLVSAVGSEKHIDGVSKNHTACKTVMKKEAIKNVLHLFSVEIRDKILIDRDNKRCN